MIVEVFVTQSQRLQALPQKLFDAVLDQIGVASIRKALGQGTAQPQPRIDPLQEQGATVTTEMATGEIRYHFART